ncbi:hypothetical protein AX17_003128 [Amanita inopinata Kibby_2008]|nr:hypothetical protein AX17_003128 [Amanita inopinata Kibby_2008]
MHSKVTFDDQNVEIIIVDDDSYHQMPQSRPSTHSTLLPTGTVRSYPVPPHLSTSPQGMRHATTANAGPQHWHPIPPAPYAAPPFGTSPSSPAFPLQPQPVNTQHPVKDAIHRYLRRGHSACVSHYIRSLPESVMTAYDLQLPATRLHATSMTVETGYYTWNIDVRPSKMPFITISDVLLGIYERLKGHVNNVELPDDTEFDGLEPIEEGQNHWRLYLSF